MSNVNTVVITGNLTRDPELRYAETSNEFVCKLRMAVNGRGKDAESGGWVDRPNYFDVVVWGEHEWVAAGARREGVEIVATGVQILGSSVPETGAAREEVTA